MSSLLKNLDPAHLKRYRDFAILLVKHGRPDLADKLGLSDYLEESDAENTTKVRAEELASDLEELGPAFVKLGQLLSTRADMLPAEYLEALSRLQDSVTPFAFEEVEAVVEEELKTPLRHAFTEFERKPIASASLGQVHRAVLPSGRLVAVKIQRPGIEEAVVRDFEAMEPIAEFLDRHTEMGEKYEFVSLLRDLRTSLMRELDYREEARSLNLLADNMANRKRIVVPLPVDDYTTNRVLTMDYVRGRKITALGPLVHSELDGDELVSELFDAYLDQVLVHGFFHADPHPGNVFLTDGNEHLALIDLGLTCQITPASSEKIMKLLLSLCEGDGEEAASYAVDLSVRKPNFDMAGFTAAVVDIALRVRRADVGDSKFGSLFLEMQGAAADHGLRLNRELRYIGKTILNLEIIGDRLATHFKPQDAITKHASKVMRGRMFDAMRPSRLLKQAAEAKEAAESLPRRLNQILDLLTQNDLKVKIDAIDEDRLMMGFQKVANRITVGLVLAAMIVGAALMMDNDVPFTVLGYPGIAIMMLFFSILIGGFLVINIIWHDITERKRR